MVGLRKAILLVSCVVLLGAAGCNGINQVSPQALEERATQRLRASVNSDIPLIKMRAIETCVDLRLSKAPDICTKAVNSPEPLLQFAGAMGLIALPTATAEPALSRLLSSNDPSVRLAAIGALQRLGRSDQMSELGSALSNPRQEVRGNALTILGRMGDKSAIEAIKPLLKGDSIEIVRLQAAEALVLLGDQSALPQLQLWQYSLDYQERSFAVQLMGQVEPPPDFSPDLLQALNDPNQLVQLQAARSLGRLGQSAGFEKALKYLNPSSWAKREIAKEMELSPDGPQMATEIRKIRRLAALALGEIGRWEAAGPLKKALDDEDQHVALAAANASLKLLLKTGKASIETVPRSGAEQ